MRAFVEIVMMVLGLLFFYIGAEAHDANQISLALWLYFGGLCFLLIFLLMTTEPVARRKL